MLLSLALVPRDAEELRRVVGLLLGVVVLVPFAVWDDFKRLGALPQLLGQILVGLHPGGLRGQHQQRLQPLRAPFGGLILPPWIAIPATVTWLVLLMNAMNWLDTMDGLAGGVGTSRRDPVHRLPQP